MPRSTEWFRRLRPGECHALDFILRTLVAEDDAILKWASHENTIARLQQQLARIPLIIVLAFRAGVFAMEWGTLCSPRHLRRFSRLPLDARLKSLEGWEFSRLIVKRDLFKLIKLTALANMLQEPELLRQIGYDDTMSHRTSGVTQDAPAPCPKGARP